ncbi:iron complex outermembrane receptor protein [Flavobacterium endophyticum]|uniref:Iron complex outermembrane receptor protein n=1 Tax=Flavobacterium endophyticum TaxID=1540163 RepID=A0A495MJ07_9FLAO|nr:TonB-dependent receptor [Flavobacterium endophyticum]RKS25981.1 iron complex outermembrane receptor protein [Flavobacterium endophyticum]
MKTLFKKNESRQKDRHKNRSQNYTSGSLLHARTLLGLAFFTSGSLFAQEKVVIDTTKTNNLDEVLVSAVRVTAQTPVTFSNISKKELESRNLGQDIPALLNYLPSVVITSDAGNGIGYSAISVRGSDSRRVNVTLNGIPYNDSESQGTFWVNMPDFASSVQNIQLQRGVGTSTNGAGAFGASLNLLTDSYATEANGEISNSFGSFNSRKHTLKFSTGLIKDHFELAGRVSNIKSDGYIDRASSDLKSYFFQGTYIGNTTLIKALVFGGKEKTYQAWNGLEDPDKLKNDRTYNTSGEYVDDNGVTRFYDNETDNYNQDHYQLHWNERFSDNWSTNLAFHYTKGKGYYENYKVDEDLSEYGIQPQVVEGELIESSDLIRRKWLDNDFYGTTFSANYKNEKLDFILGGGWNKYEGKHFGNILWTRSFILPEYNFKYYDDFSTKTDFNVFAKVNYKFNENWSLFGDLQYRNVGYKTKGADTGSVDDNFNFFNPKAGITYIVNDENNIYFSYARANREPNRSDYESGNPKPEKLNDFELGWRYNAPKTKLNVNGYYMRYQDQLVLTGALNDVGAPIRQNSGESYRLGLEIDATLFVADKWIFRPNVTVSTNKNEDFVFQRDGTLEKLGNTNIAFSPNVIVGNAITFLPIKNMQVSLLTKFVGDQYMGNIDSKGSKLESYSVSDFNISYEIKTNSVFKSIIFSGLVNNVFDYKYESNGYFYTYDDDFSNPGTITTMEGAGYYPQAGINFLAGMTLKF